MSYTLDESSPSLAKTVVPLLTSGEELTQELKIITLFQLFSISPKSLLARWKGCSLAWEISLKDVSGMLGKIMGIKLYNVWFDVQ